MHNSPRNVPLPSVRTTCRTQPRVFGHKRQRSATFATQRNDEDNLTSASESCCTTSGESSGDESDDNNSLEELVEHNEEEALMASKRRRRADLDGLKKSVRRMEAQVVDASAQLRDLAAVVAQVVARRQLQQLQRSLPNPVARRAVHTPRAKYSSRSL